MKWNILKCNLEVMIKKYKSMLNKLVETYTTLLLLKA